MKYVEYVKRPMNSLRRSSGPFFVFQTFKNTVQLLFCMFYKPNRCNDVDVLGFLLGI